MLAKAADDDRGEGDAGKSGNKEAEERRKLARKLLMAGAGAKTAGR